MSKQADLALPFRSSAEQAHELARKGKIEDDPTVQQMVLALAISDNRSLRRAAGKVLNLKAGCELVHGTPFKTPRVEELNPGLGPQNALCVGSLEDPGEPFLYPYRLLTQHMAVWGATGTGKTNLLASAALQCLHVGIRVLVLDREKRDYRALIRFRDGLLVLDTRTFRFNPLEVPEGMDPSAVITTFCTVFAKENGLLDGSLNLLRKAVTALFIERDIFQGSRSFPTLSDLLEKIRSYKVAANSRAGGYRDTLINRLEMMLASAPDMYACVRGLPISRLLDTDIVFEIDGLSEQHGRFLANYIILLMFQSRIVLNERADTIRNLVVCDEAKWLAPPGYNPLQGHPPLAYALAMAREAGIGIVLADQTADLDASIAVNSRLKVCFRLGSGDDIERVRRSMKLTDEQAAYIPKLDVGQAIVRMPPFEPFLVQVPKLRG